MTENKAALPEVPVLFADDALLVCEKPAGLLSQADASAEPSVPACLAAKGFGTVFPVHRLDRPVGGVMVYARTRAAAAALCAEVTAGTLQKEYLTVVKGCPAEPAGELRDLLYKDPRANKTFIVQRMRRGVREARLRYEVLAVLGEGEEQHTLVRVRLLTGRSHQIRVQFAGRGMPLWGDGRYGSREKGEPALWSYRLTLRHPTTQKELHFSALPAADGAFAAFAAALEACGKNPG